MENVKKKINKKFNERNFLDGWFHNSGISLRYCFEIPQVIPITFNTGLDRGVSDILLPVRYRLYDRITYGIGN